MDKIQGIHYQTGETIELTVHDGIIENIHITDTLNRSTMRWIAPGLIDLQVNGFRGIDFNSRDLVTPQIEQLTKELFATGVTSYFPTVITNSNDAIKNSLATISKACTEYPLTRQAVAGIHLEGPFISPLEGPVGAHDQQQIKAPDYGLFREFQTAAHNLVTLITLSPEWPGAAAFTRACVQDGVTVSIGHTAANSEQIREVVNAGASMSTHLGNAAHQLLPRHPNYIWDQLADEKLAASFIGDGFHLPDSVIKVLLKVKGSKAILVSDSVSLAGMPAGVYSTPVGGDVVLTDTGRLHLAANPAALAGSAQGILQALNKLIPGNFLSFHETWNLASVNPAREMKMPQQQGLAVGAPADLVLFDKAEKIKISSTYKNGHKVFQQA